IAGTTSMTYDPAGNVLSIRDYGPPSSSSLFSGTSLASYSYAYDPGARGTTMVYDGVTSTYTDDGANELLSRTGGGTGSSTRDANGNRTNASFSVGSNVGNELSTDGTWNYSYDAAEDLTGKSNGSGTSWAYSYDNGGHLVEAKETVSGTVVLDEVNK